MKHLIFANDPVDSSEWQMVETPDVLASIIERFPEWPESARLYHTDVSHATDITPRCQQDIDYLRELERDDETETFIMVIFPEDPLILLTVGLAAVSVALLLFLDVNLGATEAARSSSPNNQLNRRVNNARPLARIPDIFGKVRSTPDLISQPYRFYINHRENELAYMCIGRGEFDVTDIRDGETIASAIPGNSVEIYSPNTSPNSGDAPQLRVGPVIGLPVKTVFESNAVNGQELRPPNIGELTDLTVLATVSGSTGTLEITASTDPVLSEIELSDSYQVGDDIQIAGFSFAGGDLNGTYEIASVTSTTVSFANPSAVNPDWANVTPVTGDSSTGVSFSPSGAFWEGPFRIQGGTNVELLANFVARNGLFLRGSRSQLRFDVTLELEYTPLDSDGNPTGPAQTQQVTLEGSATSSNTRAISLRIQTDHDGPFDVRARRVTDTDLDFSGQVVDTVQWQELYTLGEVTEQDFGDVTTVLSQTAATPGALAIKERKLNMLVTRRIPTRVSGTTFTSPTATTNAADIIAAITIDQSIGRRTLDDLDLDQIYDTVDAIEEYFGNSAMREFSYTFDDLDFTYEQSVAAVAQALFSVAYRQGPKVRLAFERATTDSALVFNHRNKLPGSERRTYTFGGLNRRDGVELEYVDPDTDTAETLFRPEDQSAINPQKITTIGVRTREQAQVHADRAFNRIRYQVVSAEFGATGEGMLLVQNERVLVADNTRPETQDGEITSQTGLVLGTSQPVEFTDGENLSMHVQLSDKTVEVFDITPVAGDVYAVTIDRVPRLPLVLGGDRYARTTYTITSRDNADEEAFLIQEVSPDNSSQSATISVINYDSRYYQNDQDVRV